MSAEEVGAVFLMQDKNSYRGSGVKKVWRVVMFQDGGTWVAQCLEYDIAAQAKTIPDLKKAFESMVLGHATAALSTGHKPFENLKPAPSFYEKMYLEAEPLERGIPINLPNHKKWPPAHVALVTPALSVS